MWEFILNLVFPRQCFGCGRWDQYICENCRKSKIEYFTDQVCPYCEKPGPYGLTHPRCQKPLTLDGLFVLSHYRGLIPKLISEIKYQHHFDICSQIARIIFDAYHFKFNFQYLIPVPLSGPRLRERGFNQSEKLAKELQKCFQSSDCKLLPDDILVRNKNTKPQFDLKYKERVNNVKDAFSLSPQLKTKNLEGFSFCLVDDVATTGATLFECAKVLKRADAEKVFAITIARGG